MITDQKILYRCLSEIEELLNWGASENWTNNEFTKLSTQITNVTGISISVSSIRRLYKNTSEAESVYNPQMETKNALAIFLKYENWAHYCQNQNYSSTVNKNVKTKKFWNFTIISITGLVLIVGILIKLFVFNKIDTEKVLFEGQNLFNNKIPHTVTIKYDLADYKGPFYVDWGEYPLDGTAPEKSTLLPSKSGLISHTYYTSSSYNIKLLDKSNHVIKNVNTYISTTGWDCYVVQPDLKIKIDSSQFYFSDSLHANIEYAIAKGIDTIQPYRVIYRNTREFNLQGEDLYFSTGFMPIFRSGYVECNHVQVKLSGKTGTFLITLIAEGCSANIETFIIGNQQFNGISSNLDGFVVESGKHQFLEIVVKDFEATILLNNKKVFSTIYEEGIGEIVGIRYEFKGLGIIEDYLLANANKQKIYSAGF